MTTLWRGQCCKRGRGGARFRDRPPTECGTWTGHDGSVPGYDAVARNLDSGRQVVLLMNSVTMGDQIGGPAAQQALTEVAESAAWR